MSRDPKEFFIKKVPIPYTMKSFLVYGYIKRNAMTSKIEFNMKKSKLTYKNKNMQNN